MIMQLALSYPIVTMLFWLWQELSYHIRSHIHVQSKAEEGVNQKHCNSVRKGAFPVWGRCFYRRPLRKRTVLKWFFFDNLTGSPDTLNDYADNLTALPINIFYYSHCQRENKKYNVEVTQEWQHIKALSVLLINADSPLKIKAFLEKSKLHQQTFKYCEIQIQILDSWHWR